MERNNEKVSASESERPAEFTHSASCKSRCCFLFPNRYVWTILICFILPQLLLMNLICRGQICEPGTVFSIYLASFTVLLSAIIYLRYLESLKKIAGTNSFKQNLKILFQTLFIPVCFYIVFAASFYIVMQYALYPGTFQDLYSELEYKELSALFPEQVFTFTSGDGVEIGGYRTVFYGAENHSAVYPVVFIGGIGGSMWLNVDVGELLVSPALDNGFSFEVFSFSYRGYEPNASLAVSEALIIQDAIALLKYVTELYNGTRPLLLGHSLGTGSAIAVGAYYSQKDVHLLPACIALFTPMTNIHLLTLDLAYYINYLVVWAADLWPNIDRIKSVDESVPIAVFSALEDRLILPYQHRAVYEAIKSPNKTFIAAEAAGHDDLYMMVYADEESYFQWFNSCLSNL